MEERAWRVWPRLVMTFGFSREPRIQTDAAASEVACSARRNDEVIVFLIKGRSHTPVSASSTHPKQNAPIWQRSAGRCAAYTSFSVCSHFEKKQTFYSFHFIVFMKNLTCLQHCNNKAIKIHCTLRRGLWEHRTFIPLCFNNNQLITAIFPFSFLREHHGSDIILVLSL